MLTFYELAPSPNNLKVHLALRFKGVPFEATQVDPADRASVLEVSGQELTPVIADKGIVLNDSEAILQYLDANYRDAPRLIPADKDGRKACEAWQRSFDKRIVPSWLDVFFFAINVREAMDPASPARFREQVAWLEEQLGQSEREWSDAPIDALRIASWVLYALPGEGLIARVPLFKKFQQLFGIEAGAFPRLEELLRPWQEHAA
ncbi:MAG TPA: hypothetical protein DEA08_14590 [Planctomycetes bacterium]|nr:hypothetical protein [Planctomycetota bacterium]